ncbi:hypothetical protein [Spirochaeta africana]|nr:hypothetical protein [Spirochaeta africana]
MTGILIGTLLFFTRMIGGAAPAEALQIAGQFIFVWNAVAIGAAVVAVGWFLGGNRQPGKRPETALLSGLVALLGLAGAVYLRSGKAAWWYGGSALVLLGSGVLAWGGLPGAGAGVFGAAAIAGGQYLRALHQREVSGTSGARRGYHTAPGAGNTRTDRNPPPPNSDGMRYAGGQSLDETTAETRDPGSAKAPGDT